MKYFAKYLPVEGEIKKGDLIPFDNCPPKRVEEVKGNILWIEDQEDWPEELLRYEVKDCKKVQLFLCSRDIKVGDKEVYSGIIGVYESNEPEIISEIKDEFQLKFIKGIAEGAQVYPFKIVGLISPEATWIKEGDEFEEDQIHKCFVPNKGNPMIRKIQIKGLCDHFH